MLAAAATSSSSAPNAAAAEVRTAQTSSEERSMRGVLPIFSGAVKDWPAFRFQMESVLDVEGLLIVVLVDKKPSDGSAHCASVIGVEEEIDEVVSLADEKKAAMVALIERKSKRAFMMIACSLRTADLVSLIADVPRGNAYEAWRRLKQHYGGGSNPVRRQQLIAEFSQIKQKRGEKVALFGARIKEAVLELKAIGEKVSVSAMQAAFTSGLLSPQFDSLRMMLPMFGHKELQETINAYAAEAAEMQFKVDAKVEDFAEYEHAYGSQVVRGSCFGCGEVGHKVQDCPKPCPHCGVLGHSEDRCFKKRNQDRAAGPQNLFRAAGPQIVMHRAAGPTVFGAAGPQIVMHRAAGPQNVFSKSAGPYAYNLEEDEHAL